MTVKLEFNISQNVLEVPMLLYFNLPGTLGAKLDFNLFFLWSFFLDEDNTEEVVWGDWVGFVAAAVAKQPNPDDPEALDLLKLELGDFELEHRWYWLVANDPYAESDIYWKKNSNFSNIYGHLRLMSFFYEKFKRKKLHQKITFT